MLPVEVSPVGVLVRRKLALRRVINYKRLEAFAPVMPPPASSILATSGARQNSGLLQTLPQKSLGCADCHLQTPFRHRDLLQTCSVECKECGRIQKSDPLALLGVCKWPLHVANAIDDGVPGEVGVTKDVRHRPQFLDPPLYVVAAHSLCQVRLE